MPHPQLFPSDSQTCPENVQPSQERGLQAPWPVGGRPVGGCQPLNAQGILGATGAGSRVSVLVGRGAAVGSPAMMWGPGAQAKPHGWALSSPTSYTPKSTCLQRHSAPGLAGRMVARRPEDEGTWHFCLVTCHLVSSAWVAPGLCVHPSTWRGWICFSGNPVF